MLPTTPERSRSTTGRAAALIALSLCFPAIAAPSGPAPLGTLRMLDPARLSWPSASTAAELASAMQAHRAFATRAASAYPAESLHVPGAVRFRWVAPDGAAINRVSEGVFSFTTAGCLASFCREVRCQAAGWPNFRCSDGVDRVMAAPDLATVVFDGVTYSRVLPELSEPVPDPVLP